jgi:hypothetical protein
LYVLLARGVVLEMPQLPSADSKGSSMAGTPIPEDPSLSVSSADKDQKLEGIREKVASRSAKL